MDCVGGLRAPWRSINKVPRARLAGQQLRGVLNDFIRRHPGTLKAADGDPSFTGTDEHTLDLLRSELASCMGVCGTERGISSWRPNLVRGYVDMSCDPEVELPE